MAAEQGVVVAHAEDPAGQANVGADGEGLELCHEVVDGVDRAVRRREQVGADGLRAELLRMRVTVDEPGQQCPASEIDRPGRGTTMRLVYFGTGADRDDPAVPDRDRLRGDGLVACHGDDGAAGKDRVRDGGRRHFLGRVCDATRDEHRAQACQCQSHVPY